MIILLILVVLSLVIIRPFTVLIHELGHGIPALLLTDDKVTLYIGSYGEYKNSLHFDIGRLEFFFKYNPLLWKLGLCVHNTRDLTLNQHILITLFGPLSSLLLGSLFFYLALTTDLHGSIKIISVVFLASSMFDFFLNIIPSEQPIRLHGGKIAYNDGQQLKQLVKLKKLSPEYGIAIEYYNNENYSNAAKEFHSIIYSGQENDMVYRLAISSYLQCKDYKIALSLHYKFDKQFNLDSNDYANSGLLKSRLGKYLESLNDYQKSLNLNPHNKYALNNRGYTYNILQQYENAIVDFNRAIKIDTKFAYSYNNRGLSKIKLKQEKEGLKDIQTSMEIDKENSYAYRNLGIYQFDKGNLQKALELFKKSYMLDEDTDLINELINKTEQLLQSK